MCGRQNAAIRTPSVVQVRSNVRRFRQQHFALWRCQDCLSIHARDDVDLAGYYQNYPFNRQELNWPLRRAYGVLVRRMKRAGVRRQDRILDFGCGKGLLVELLRSKGYDSAVGYDAYCQAFHDPAVLDGRYDCLFAQDVLEHVDDPIGTLRTFAGLVKAGGLIIIGTPNAAAIDLVRAEKFVHSLHQPYHRHVLSKQALLAAAEALGWKLLRLYSTAYTNTRVPLLNTRFLLRYLKASDDTVDAAFEQLRGNVLNLLKPKVFFDAFFGSFRDPGTEMLAVFRSA
jgi:2-polyprenyl-3-methyl-5-hydroxy-6-metoxy-1,4-benzoquinol methylase